MKSLLVVGCGSIGRRHMKVFRELGVEFIGGADHREDRVNQALDEAGANAVAQDHRQALADHAYDAVVVATPPHLHTSIALDAAAAGCHLFIEKPLATDDQGLDELEATCRSRSLVAYTAYCYRFIPSVERLRQLLDSSAIGRPLCARLHISSYLPDWHPWEDYREFYMASKAQGGGALFDESHGIDLLRWLFGQVRDVSAFVGNVSDLEISSDDLSVVQLRFANGLVAQGHFDLLGRTPRIGLEVTGSEGTILWDRIDPKISVYKAGEGAWATESFPANDTVQSYGRQAQHFLNCISSGANPRTPLNDGRQTLSVLTAAAESSASGRVITVSNDALAA